MPPTNLASRSWQRYLCPKDYPHKLIYHFVSSKHPISPTSQSHTSFHPLRLPSHHIRLRCQQNLPAEAQGALPTPPSRPQHSEARSVDRDRLIRPCAPEVRHPRHRQMDRRHLSVRLETREKRARRVSKVRLTLLDRGSELAEEEVSPDLARLERGDEVVVDGNELVILRSSCSASSVDLALSPVEEVVIPPTAVSKSHGVACGPCLTS